MAHGASFPCDCCPRQQSNRSVEKTGPLEWVKASSVTYFVTYDKEVSRNIEDTHEMPRSE